jgi:plastocyanin
MMASRHRPSTVALMLVVSVALVAYGTAAGTPSSAFAAGTIQNAVTISGFAFAPATITVPVGTKVTWTNQDSTDHTVTADDGNAFDSGNIANGATFSFTFTTAGTFPYHCAIHPSMTARVIVTTATSTASHSPTPGRTATPPPTSMAGDRSSNNSTPLSALLICLALGGFGVVAVEAQRRKIRT